MVRKEVARSLAQRLVLLSGLGFVLLASAALAEAPKLEVESYLIPSADPGIQLYKQIMGKYYPDGKIEDGFNVYGMATAYSLVDVLKKAGPNLTRQAVLDQMNNLNEPDNPFLFQGIGAKNTPSDHYTITQEYLAKYATSANNYQPLSQVIDVRGQIKYP